MKVLEDNLKLEKDIQEWKMNIIIKDIQKVYDARYDELWQIQNAGSDKNKDI